MNSPYLFKYEEAKWDWTKSAASLFMNGFKRFDKKIDDREQVYVGVYGPTQVGKTTFILRLLGIGFTHLNNLSDSLRGGREKGKSATITCTIFQRSTTADFQVVWPSGEIHLAKTFDDLEKVMANLRVSIYKNKSFSVKPVIVKIPKQYFNHADIDSRVRDLSIIDLPGDDSKDNHEMLHVNRVLKEYIARCKVCIIMEISSQMTALTKLEKDLVKDWLVLPEQFRILLTRSVSNGSVMEQIVAKQITSAEQFKQLYHDELARVCEQHELATAIYPLEFGDSWLDLKRGYPNIFNQASKWIDEIFEELVKDLTSIDSPEQEIKKLKSMERFIVKESQDELNRLQSEIEVMELEKQEFQLNFKHLTQLLEKEERKLTRLGDVQKEWSRFILSAFPSVDFYSWSNLTVGTKKASYLKSQFRGNVRELEDFAKAQVELLNIKIRGDCRLISTNLPEMDFPEEIFQTYLHFDYLIDRYLLESSYSSDVSYAKRKLADAKDGFEQEICKHVEKCRDLLKEPFRNQKAAIKLEKEELKQMNKQLQVKNNKLQSLLDEMLKVKKEWKSDIGRAKQLDFFLMESFVNQSNVYKMKIEDVNTNSNEKWYTHQYWNVLKMQAERIIDYVE